MCAKAYEIIEHTADIGIRVKGKNFLELFKNAGLAVFEITSEKKKVKTTRLKKIVIKQEAENIEELFFNWLNEIISLSAAKGLIFTDFKIKKLDKNNIEAIACAEKIEDYKVNTEIKAATYHGLKIEKTASGWLAEVIFDV